MPYWYTSKNSDTEGAAIDSGAWDTTEPVLEYLVQVSEVLIFFFLLLTYADVCRYRFWCVGHQRTCSRVPRPSLGGTHFTRFTRTTAQILTQRALLGRVRLPVAYSSSARRGQRHLAPPHASPPHAGHRFSFSFFFRLVPPPRISSRVSPARGLQFFFHFFVLFSPRRSSSRVLPPPARGSQGL